MLISHTGSCLDHQLLAGYPFNVGHLDLISITKGLCMQNQSLDLRMTYILKRRPILCVSCFLFQFGKITILYTFALLE